MSVCACFIHVLTLQSDTWGAHKGMIHPEKRIVITTCPIWQPKMAQQTLNLATQTAAHSWAMVRSSLTELFICLFELLFFTQLHFYPPRLWENVLSCFHPTFLAFNSIRSISISLQTLLLLYGSALYRGLFRVYVDFLSNASWKLLGCDQRPYKSDSLINIKHSVRKKKAHKHCTAS